MRCIAVMAIVALFASATLADDTLWTRTYLGPGATLDQGKGVATIGSEIFVAGTQQMPPNILLIRYHANGDTAWVRVHDLDTMENTVDVAVGSDTGPVVCVNVQSVPPKAMVVKFNKAGDTVWTRHFPSFMPSSMVLDGQDNIYVWGSYFGTMPNESLGLLKFQSNGTLAWQKAFDYGSMQDRSECLAATADGVVATARVDDSTGSYRLLVKFNSSGDTVWKRSLDTLMGADPQCVVCDPSGAIFVAAAQGARTVVVRCSTSGRVEWLQTIELPLATDAFNAIAIDPGNRVVVAGANVFPVPQAVVIKLTETGELYSTNYGPDSLAVTVYGVATDPSGHPIVTGVTQTPPQSCITFKFTGTVGVEEGQSRPTAARPAGARISRAGTPVTVGVKSAGAYRVALFDARGALVQQLHDGFLGEGDHRFTVSAPAAGNYFLRVAGAGSVAETKLVQVK